MKQDLSYNLLIKYSAQQQIHYNGNVFGNKCCHCKEGSLYIGKHRRLRLVCRFAHADLGLHLLLIA